MLSDKTHNMQVFSKEWFDKYQKTLCWLANNRYTKRWFRYVLRIHSYDCPLNVNINRIEPNAFWFGAVKKGEAVEVKADFRTHNKFSKRLYFAFKPMWWAFHAWDWLVADRFVPALSFGFSTLTAYPVPGTTVDGYVGRFASATSWASITGGAGNEYDYTSANTEYVGFNIDNPNNLFLEVVRCIFLFNTSSLTSGATISAAIMSLYGSGKNNGTTLTTGNIDIYTSSPASNTVLANSDYANLGATSQTGSPITYTAFSTSGYNDFTFNATGRGNVSKTDVSKFGARNAIWDANGVAPPFGTAGSSWNISGYYSDQSGTSQDPKLVVTYTVATASGASFLYLMV